MIVAKNLRVDELGEPLFEKVNQVIHSKERIAVVGSSTSLATTFLRIIAAEVEPDEGTIKVEGERLLYLSPESLSGSARALTQVFHTRPTFLLIDAGAVELGTDALESLTQIVQGFRGGILITSENSGLMQVARATRVLELNSITKTVTSYAGKYEMYLIEKKKRDAQVNEAYEKQQREKRRLEAWLEQKRKEAAANRSPEKGATIRAKVKYLRREILDKEIPNPNLDSVEDV
jgi:ATPase subunit of ABC transporter with duplicated ATPase domains